MIDDLHEPFVLGGAADFGGCRDRILRGAEDRAAEARIGVEPPLAKPIVVRSASAAARYGLGITVDVREKLLGIADLRMDVDVDHSA